MLPSPPTSSPIDTNLPCLKCRYNLRTLHADGLCPECGAPVQLSLNHHQRCDGLDIRSLVRGTWLLAAAPIAGILLLVAWAFLQEQGWLPWDLWNIYYLSMPRIVEIALVIPALLLLARSQLPVSNRLLLRRTCQLYALVGLCIIILPCIAYFLLTPQNQLLRPPANARIWTYYTMALCRAAQDICRVALCLFAWRFFLKLAHRINSKSLAWAAPCFFWTYAAVYLIGIAVDISKVPLQLGLNQSSWQSALTSSLGNFDVEYCLLPLSFFVFWWYVYLIIYRFKHPPAAR